MSGGRFNYVDSYARWEVEEALTGIIERLSDKELEDDQPIELESAIQLKQVYEIVAEWAHDFDWASSGDTSFESLPNKVEAHKARLLEVLR